jgi:hypothetical protein
MKTSWLRVTMMLLVLAILAGASSLLISIGYANASSGTTTTSPTPNLKVGPQLTTNVPLIYDTDSNGFGGGADMVGPVIGSVSYRQGSDGRLNVVLHADFAQPNTTYQTFLVCGPSHALACGFTTVGNLTTNAAGMGNESLTVSLAKLQAAPYGCGYRTDHIDLIGGSLSSTLAAGAINYFVPCASGTAPTAPTGTGDPTGI